MKEKYQYIRQLEKKKKQGRFSSILNMFKDKDPAQQSNKELEYFNEMQRKKMQIDGKLDGLKAGDRDEKSF